MARSIGLAEYIQADFHQIVTAILFTIALQIRFLSRHQIGLLDSIYFIGIQTLHLHVHHRLLVAWVQVVCKENGTLFVLAYIVVEHKLCNGDNVYFYTKFYFSLGLATNSV